MPRPDAIEVAGTVTEVISDAMFRVTLANGHVIRAKREEQLRENISRILPGDKVMLEVSPYDLSTGRITCRQE